ncbi:hypothetical protein [Sutcliffiella deserti]|uniref:hypothetical protein n=1 Tax=Sutcliffiella deserti TaxID=2875501 RepID=UPI001CBDD239|nr:hypothetical protein [Sutcliffiella deserti]
MLKANNKMVQELLYKLDNAYVDYELEIQKLNEEIERLVMANNKQQMELEKTNLMDSTLQSLFSYMLKNTSFKAIQLFLAENNEDNITNRLELAHKLLKQGEYDFVLNWSKHIISLQFSDTIDVKKWTPIIIEVLNQIMDKEYGVIEERNKKYLSVLQFIHDLIYSEYHDVIFDYLERFYDYFHDLIMDNNEPIIILKYIDCILDYNHKEIFSKIMNNLVDDWLFLDANVSETEFTRILFYSYLNELDIELVNKAKIGREFLLLHSPEINLYNTLYSIINKETPYQIGRDRIEDLKLKQTIFNENHFKWISEKIYQQLSKLQTNFLDEVKQEVVILEQQSLKRTNQLYYIPNTIMKVYTDLINYLIKENVILNLYKNKQDFIVRKEIVVDSLFSQNTGKHYITEDMVKEINKSTNLWFDVREPISESVFQENNLALFKWPSTEISEATSPLSEKELRNNSDLKKIGYQITGLTRQKRWEILSKKAVPQLGLKKVVYTIAFLVRGRKSMKNGLIRNRNSITEWEHDLIKLKQSFYNKDFNWPKT